MRASDSSIATPAFLFFVMSVACGRGGVMDSQTSVERDRQAIEALNDHDVKATLASDVDAIVSQWTEDFAVLPPAGPIVRGRTAMAAATKRMQQQQILIPLAYEVNFEELTVTGDYAFAWGTYRSAARPSAGGDDIFYSGKLMRIFQRQPDNSWKMHRTMMTADTQVR